jgi:oligopeptide/dipeptide ABC transporter ATP-binding protein
VNDELLLEVKDVSKGFPVRSDARLGFTRRKQRTRALVDVSLGVREGETLGIVGESGCGKTTLGRLVVGLLQPDAGAIFYHGRNLNSLDVRERRRIQMVFQNPYLSLNPRITLGKAIAEPLRVYRLVPRSGLSPEVDRLLEQVGLSPAVKDQYPSELSGGQRQRAAIARALAVSPEVLVADEAVASLDVSIQAQVLNLLADLRDTLNLTLVMISHDLGVIEYLCDRVGVMYLGHLVELGRGADVFEHSGHPYTRGLLDSIPSLDPHKRPVESAVYGELPSAVTPPEGCAFQTRCRRAANVCATQPQRVSLADNHWAECFFAEEVAREPSGLRSVASPPGRP